MADRPDKRIPVRARYIQTWSKVGMKTVRIFSDRIQDRIRLEEF
jgi:hypothetical protein